jgi:hypothetical protein
VEVPKVLREVQVHQEMEELRAQLVQQVLQEQMVLGVIQVHPELVVLKVQQEQKVLLEVQVPPDHKDQQVQLVVQEHQVQ